MGIFNSKDGKLEVFSRGNVSDQQVGPQKQAQGEEAIQAWLVSKLSELVEVPSQDIDVRQPFVHYGLDSRQAAILSGDLEDWLGRRLPPTLVYDYPSIEVLAHYLAEGPNISESVPKSDMD